MNEVEKLGFIGLELLVDDDDKNDYENYAST